MIHVKVSLTSPYQVHCQNCNGLVMKILLVDEFMKLNSENYFILNADDFPSSLLLESQPIQTNAYFFVKNIRCRKCQFVLGQKFYSVNIQLLQLLDKNVIKVSSVTIWKGEQNFTLKLRDNFDNYLNQEADKQQDYSKFEKDNFNKDLNKQIQEKQIQISQKTNYQLQQQNKPKKRHDLGNQNQIIKEITNGFGFFATILTKIDKRVSDLESVSGILKKRIQKTMEHKKINPI